MQAAERGLHQHAGASPGYLRPRWETGVGVAVDVYHGLVGPEARGADQGARARSASSRITSATGWYPTRDLLNDRGMNGATAVIDLPRIRSWIEAAGVYGASTKVELFSERATWWKRDPDDVLATWQAAPIGTAASEPIAGKSSSSVISGGHSEANRKYAGSQAGAQRNRWRPFFDHMTDRAKRSAVP